MNCNSKKTFDTVNFSILLDKLKFYGLSGNSINLIDSYLSNRYCYVKINESVSSHKLIDTGVPQGSILGPLLFIIYINDIPSSIDKCNINLYADDTAIYFGHSDAIHVEKILQNEMFCVYEWLKTNKLSLNLTKTVGMIITTQQNNF